jgi:hypothetical protein
MVCPSRQVAFHQQQGRAMQHRNNLKQTTSLEDRLATFAKEAREKAAQLPPGLERTELLKKAQRAETTRPSDWTITSASRPAKS